MMLARYFGFAAVADDKLEVNFGRLEQHGECPGIVDVVADVGIEDDGNRLAGAGRSRSGAAGHRTKQGRETCDGREGRKSIHH